MCWVKRTGKQGFSHVSEERMAREGWSSILPFPCGRAERDEVGILIPQVNYEPINLQVVRVRLTSFSCGTNGEPWCISEFLLFLSVPAGSTRGFLSSL
jgi:hypothetical protein